jgi:hypothetical protein
VYQAYRKIVEREEGLFQIAVGTGHGKLHGREGGSILSAGQTRTLVSLQGRSEKTMSRSRVCCVALPAVLSGAYAEAEEYVDRAGYPNAYSVLTRPLTFEGRSLNLNAEVGSEGWIKTAIRSADFQPIQGDSFEDGKTIASGGVKVPVDWDGGGDLDLPCGRHYRIEFQMRNAGLYSFWIDREKGGSK